MVITMTSFFFNQGHHVLWSLYSCALRNNQLLGLQQMISYRYSKTYWVLEDTTLLIVYFNCHCVAPVVPQ